MGHREEWRFRKNLGVRILLYFGWRVHSLRMASCGMGPRLCGWASQKATLNFVAKFLRLLVRSECGQAKLIIKSVGRSVVVAALVAGWRWTLRVFGGERYEGIRDLTTYRFPCLIFDCRGDCSPDAAL
ncbi:hypothetical protein H5410_005562 [Solanum commersonii]|uniref:Uncharacterized protein n=1 Tax=Solanum commersonii TaxID=4109 RepID=A0A9J6A7H4_SOLCO|nr:hypothetical protein H5410_005562 [Solanum commersonii]